MGRSFVLTGLVVMMAGAASGAARGASDAMSAAAAVAPAAGGQDQSTPAAGSVARTVWDGLYSEAQAARGKDAYLRSCAECHMPDLAGHEYAGALAGYGFQLKWEDASLAEVYGRIRTMPLGRGGTLTPQEYLDITAYVLQANGYPAGAEELGAAVAGQRWPRVRIERKRP